MYKFYIPNGFDEEQTVNLPEEEAKHAVRVLRLKEGDAMILLDGNGKRGFAKIESIQKRGCQVRVTRIESFPQRADFSLHIAIAPTKNLNRMEWMVEKCTEIGIDKLTPILCENSERKTLKIDRLYKIAISAMKQSGRVFLPKIENMCTYAEFMSTHSEGFIAHCKPNSISPPWKTQLNEKQQKLTLLIGPEGDFNSKEITLALENGYKEVSLGSSILRTETAAVYACSVANSYYE